jgi:hypothetical protein
MNMKKIYNSIFLIALAAIGFSCADESLDPIKLKEVKKGTILALRGQALDNLYNKGIPIAEVFPRIATGTEKFTFEAEILALDPATVASVDVFVVKKVGTASERIPLVNVPFASFAAGAYLHPSTTITLNFPDVLTAIGIAPTFPLSTTSIDILLGTYGFGIPIEVDMNLVDGTKVLASDIVAAGLFGSNQFYPAMVMTWAMTDYCAYVEDSWGGQWFGDEVGVGVFSPPGGDNVGVFVKLAPHTWRMDNFFGDGPGVYATIVFSPSTNPDEQIVKYLNDPGLTYQLTSEGGKLSGSGTYNQCLDEFSLNTTYDATKWIYNFHR